MLQYFRSLSMTWKEVPAEGSSCSGRLNVTAPNVMGDKVVSEALYKGTDVLRSFDGGPDSAASAKRTASLRVRWRFRMLIALTTGEMLYSMSRRALALAAPQMKQQDGIGEKQIGAIASALAAVYAVSKFSAAVVTDHVSCRTLFSVGLVGTGLCNLLFGEFSTSLAAMSLLWGFNGVCQGGGWPSAAKLMLAWYPPDVRGSYWSMVSSGTNLGNGAAPLILSYVMHHYGWRAGFQAAGAVAVVASPILYGAIRDNPAGLGIEEDLFEEDEAAKELISVCGRDQAAATDGISQGDRTVVPCSTS